VDRCRVDERQGLVDRLGDDADCLGTRHDAWPHYGPMHDARRCRRSMHEDDDVDWMGDHGVAIRRHKSDVDWSLHSDTSDDAAAYCCFYTASKPRCAVT